MSPKDWEEIKKILGNSIGQTDDTNVMAELAAIKDLLGEAESELSEL